MFVGVHDRQLDDKSRVALPAAFRSELGDRCYLSVDEAGCITLRESTEFENHARELIALEKEGRLTRNQRRAFATSSTQVSIDKQGRITIDEKFRSHAGLAAGDTVTIAGNFDAIELWRPSRYATVEDEGSDERQVRVWDDGS